MSSLSFGKLLHATSVYLFLFAVATGCGSAQTSQQLANGAIVHSETGIVHVEVCSESVIHVFASASPMPIKSLVPTVIRPCENAKFTTSSDDSALDRKSVV